MSILVKEKTIWTPDNSYLLELSGDFCDTEEDSPLRRWLKERKESDAD